ncbi:ComF family protein [Liberibacter crescens]|nr:amidophosphoribosyltransferase [Liberibacter crescens]
MSFLKGQKALLYYLNQGKLLVQDFSRTFLNFLYPHLCPICKIIVDRRRCLCAKCWAGVCFISSPMCPIMGTPFAYNHGKGALNIQVITNPPAFYKLRSVALHEGVARDLVHLLKYYDRIDLAPMMASWMLRVGHTLIIDSDLIIAVPLHRLRLIERKYNQSAELARLIALYSNKPALFGTLIRIHSTRTQVGLSLKSREENLRNAFILVKGLEKLVAGKKIVLVDDVYTTGTTVTAATNVLKKAGASRVSVLTFSLSSKR